jgi:hypothetical protein
MIFLTTRQLINKPSRLPGQLKLSISGMNRVINFGLSPPGTKKNQSPMG